MAHLLLIEDERILAMVLSETLREEGHTVTVAHDGDEGLALMIEEPPPDLVILDLEMPLVGGRTVLETMRSEPRLQAIPVVVLSGAVPWSSDFPQDGGYQAFVAKPFAMPDLMRAIYALLSSRSSSA